MKNKYSFAREISDYRLKKEKIKLPANDKGEPDWDFMEEYIKKKAENVIFNEKGLYSKNLEKLNIDLSKWKEFNSEKIFDISLGFPIHKINVEFSSDGMNYITRTAFNNGCAGKILNEEKLLNEGNCITIGAEGVKAFYQEESFFTGNKIGNKRRR